MKINHTNSFFCGHIAISKTSGRTIRDNSQWRRSNITQKQYDQHCNIFYKGFVDSLFTVESCPAEGAYKQLEHWVYDVDRTFDLQLNNSVQFKLKRIHLFQFPFEVSLFALEIEGGEVDLDDLTRAHHALRNISQYATNNILIESGYLDLIEPLLSICQSHEYAQLEKTGNKLKIFQILYSDTDEIADETLYEVGSLSPSGAVKDHSNMFSPSDQYFSSIIEEHKMSVFRDWKALMLFDTTSIIKQGVGPATCGFDQWTDCYFRVVYIHCLYQRTLLFDINQQFRHASVNRSDIHRLVNTIKEQEYYYAFTKVSYNFLPQMFYDSIIKSFDISNEREQLKMYMDQEDSKQRSINEDKFNLILSFIAILSIFSTLYDGTSLVKDFLNLDNGEPLHKIIVFFGSAVVSSVLVVILLMKYISKIWRR